jgi:membrane protease YdiL (CAAX protease family)
MPISPAHRATLRWIFTGSDGIRAGWSILIFLLVVAIPAGALNLILHFVFHIHRPAPSHTLTPLVLLAIEAVSIAFFLGATACMAWIEHRPLRRSYGLDTTRLPSRTFIGWAGGFLCLSLLVALLAAGGFLVFDGEALHGLPILTYGLLWLAAFALVGISEEITFRGYLQSTLTRGLGFWPASILTSLLFGLAHVPNHGESALGLSLVVAAGLVFCILLRASGSLWMGIGFHAAWDWAQSYFYGTPDSGMLAQGHFLLSHAAGNARFSGSEAGPEGSALAAPVMIAGLLALIWVCRRPGSALAAE